MPLTRTPQAALAAVAPLTDRLARPEVGRLLPSGRSLACGFALAALAAAGYVGARTTSVFAIQRIEIRGLHAADAAAARAALEPLAGRSLVSVRRAEVQRLLADVPGLRSYEYDRAFPHTLAIRARPELPVAVLRRGSESWLVSRRGRVLRRVPRGALLALPRIWAPRRVDVTPGATLPADAGGGAARALALLADGDFPGRARTVRAVGELTYVLASGLEMRLGSFRDSRLKLAVAARIFPLLDPDTEYLDVTVPARPVAGTNPQLGGRG